MESYARFQRDAKARQRVVESAYLQGNPGSPLRPKMGTPEYLRCQDNVMPTKES